MPIDEIKPGMVGIGRTVFEGTDLQEFKAHILGVLHNIQGPHRDLILARLEGGPLAKTGVAAGMSGSPVYIDGRLIGAVSYSIGAFPTEAIAGITPIAEMKDATQMTRRAGIAGAHRAADHARRAGGRARRDLRAARAVRQSSGRRPGHRACRPPTGAQLGAMLRPISTPLVMSGFEPESADLLAGAFGAAGFTPVARRRARRAGRGGAQDDDRAPA